MADLENLLGQHILLRQESANLRADSILTRISTAQALCDIAETKLRWAAAEDAAAVLARIRVSAAEIEFHLRDPRHIPMDRTEELWKLLTRLEERLERIEKSIRPARARHGRPDGHPDP